MQESFNMKDWWKETLSRILSHVIGGTILIVLGTIIFDLVSALPPLP
jgi:hypothetical protein